MPSVPRSSQASPRSAPFAIHSHDRHKFECAAQAHLLAQKRRIPLATKYNVNSNVAAASSKICLPRALPRPVLGEVETSSLVGAYPDLAGIPAEYIRERLALSRPKMRAALQAVEISISKSTLPTELDILMNEVVSFACPTHMFGRLQRRATSHRPQTPNQPLPHPRPRLWHALHQPPYSPPASRPSSSSSYTTVPVVPLPLPSPETFSLLHAYLYTQQPAVLLASLARPCETDLLQLAAHANKIHGLWRNACLLGLVDAQLYDVIEASWESTIAAMQACS
ncbi:hypothetical protein C8F04DRAFT_1238546 [Mycena alexandri]|uniref:Uncharacterized protein n=1 Tax=Mycena alexandri TaxID=1745969 RepID=A0AAD6SG76_9AGAR|nr:hypothetical protein C8F04DRAFT_1238546 [Mycena alexandri]